VAPKELDPFKFKEKSLRGSEGKEDNEVNDLFNKIVNANDGSDNSLNELRKTLDLNNFITLKSSFKNHNKVIAKLNNMDKLWTSKLYAGFAEKTISELNAMAGNPTKMRGKARAQVEDYSDLPKEWTKWVDEG